MGLLDKVQTSAPSLPTRAVLYAAEKSGKTSFGCHAPKPIFLMTAGETGLLTLIESGQVPPTSHFGADFRTWHELMLHVRAIRDEKHDYKTLVLDTGNGAESLCMASVCESSFSGDWGEYNSYGRGMSATVPIWAEFLGTLDQVRLNRKMSILFLHHAKVKTFQDPAGKDWDQWRPEANDKLWGLTHKWADVIAYYGQRVAVSRDDKAQGTATRFLRVGSSPAMVAGNRYGMPDELVANKPGAKALWDLFANTLRQCKSKSGEQQLQPATDGKAKTPLETPGLSADGIASSESAFKSAFARCGMSWSDFLTDFNDQHDAGFTTGDAFWDLIDGHQRRWAAEYVLREIEIRKQQQAAPAA